MTKETQSTLMALTSNIYAEYGSEEAIREAFVNHDPDLDKALMEVGYFSEYAGVLDDRSAVWMGFELVCNSPMLLRVK